MCFAIRRGEVERLDPKFIIHGGHQRLRGVSTATLGSLVVREPDYGAPCRAVPREADEIKYIRVSDFDDFGIPEGHQFMTAETIEDRFMLADGDMLFARSGATAGKTFLYSADLGPALFAGYCIRFRFDRQRVLPEFVYLYSKMDRYTAWVRSIQRPSGQPNINKEEFKSFTIPVPDIPEQSRLVAALDAARAARRQKLAQADALLSGLDGFVLNALGLTLPPPDGRMAYGVRLADTERRRLDPHFFHPEFRELARRVVKIPHRPLGRLVRLSHETWSPVAATESSFRYIEISGVNTATGEVTAVDTPVAEAPSRARMQVRRGDIIVSLTRPHYGAIAIIDDTFDGCIASTGFAVLRDSLVEDLDRSYLWCVLRSKVSLMQIQQRSSGGNYPAITEDELERVVIPLPDSKTKIQQTIAVEVARRRDEARRLRDEACTIWDDAKRRFEEELLGPETNAEEPKTDGAKGGRKQ